MKIDLPLCLYTLLLFLPLLQSLPYPANDDRYWTFDQWKKSLPVQERARKRSPSLQQQYKEISIDTSKLYNDFVKAFTNKNKNSTKNSSAEIVVEPQRRTLKNKSGPSIANFDNDTKELSEKSQQRQYVNAISNNSPTMANFDPYLKTQAFVKNNKAGPAPVSPNYKPDTIPPVASMNLPPQLNQHQQNQISPPVAPPQPPPPPRPPPAALPKVTSAPAQPPSPFIASFQPPIAPPVQLPVRSAAPPKPPVYMAGTPPPPVTFPKPQDITQPKVTGNNKLRQQTHATMPTPKHSTKAPIVSSANLVHAASLKPTVVPSNNKANQLIDPAFNMPGAFDIQQFDAEVVPDGKGGMKILDIKSNGQNKQPLIKTTMKQISGIAPKTNRPVIEKVMNNPRNNQKNTAVMTEEKSSSSAAKRVYSLGDHIFSDVGCFLDKWIRSIPTLEGNHALLMDSDYKSRSDPLQKCAEAALDKNLKVFGLQNGGQCFAGVNGENRYNIYGPSDLCRDDGLGGSWANEVYMYNSDPRFSQVQPPKHKSGAAKDLFPEVSLGDTNFEKVEEDDYDRNLLKEEQELSETDRDKVKPDASTFKGVLGKIVNKAVGTTTEERDTRRKHSFNLMKNESADDFDMVKIKPNAERAEEANKPKKLIDLFKSKTPDGEDFTFSSMANHIDTDTFTSDKSESRSNDKPMKDSDSLKAVKELFKTALAEKNKADIQKEKNAKESIKVILKDGGNVKENKDKVKEGLNNPSDGEKDFNANEKGIENDKEREREIERQKDREKDKEKEREKEVEKMKEKELQKEEELIKEMKNSKEKEEKEKELQQKEKELKEKEAKEKEQDLKEKEAREAKEKAELKEKEVKEKESKEKELKEKKLQDKKENETKIAEAQQKANVTNLSHIVSEEKHETPKQFPMGSAVTNGKKPPCICPDKLCSSKLDLAFVIDASAGSEQGGKDKMAETMEFGRRVASAFKVAPEESRVGLVTYATDAQIMMNFHRFSDPDALTEARNAVRVKPHTGKYTGQALSLAKEGLFDVGHRADALDVMILMTDGPSSDDITEPARALRDMGVKIICVGLGQQIDKNQLNDMASDPDEDHVFTADYDNLATIIRRTQKAACVGGTLRDPINPCTCDLRGGANDRESAAFYDIYKAAVESPFMSNDGEMSRYDKIPRPTKMDRKDIIRTGKQRSLPLDNPHPRYAGQASPLVELSIKGRENADMISHDEKSSKQSYTQVQDFVQAVATSPDEVYIPDQSNGKSSESTKNDYVMNDENTSTKQSEENTRSKQPSEDDKSKSTDKPEDSYKNVMSIEESSVAANNEEEKNSPFKKVNEHLVDQYLKTHSPNKNGDANQDDAENKNNKFNEPSAIESEIKTQESDEISSKQIKVRQKAKDLIDDDHFSISSEGKKHFTEEEQLLSNSKPKLGAGGAHHLPLETMQKQEDEQLQSSESRKPSSEKTETEDDKEVNSEDNQSSERLFKEKARPEENKENKYKDERLIKEKEKEKLLEESPKSSGLPLANPGEHQDGRKPVEIKDATSKSEEKADSKENSVEKNSESSIDIDGLKETQENDKNLKDINSDLDVAKSKHYHLANQAKVQEGQEAQNKANEELKLFKEQRKENSHEVSFQSNDRKKNDKDSHENKERKNSEEYENESKLKYSEKSQNEQPSKIKASADIQTEKAELVKDKNEKESEKDMEYYSAKQSNKAGADTQKDMQNDIQKDMLKNIHQASKDDKQEKQKEEINSEEKQKQTIKSKANEGQNIRLEKESNLEEEEAEYHDQKNPHLVEHDQEVKRLQKEIKKDTNENEQNKLAKEHEDNNKKTFTKEDRDIMAINDKGGVSEATSTNGKLSSQLTDDPESRTSDFYDVNIMKRPDLTEEDKEQLHAIQTTLMNADSEFLSNGPLQQFKKINQFKNGKHSGKTQALQTAKLPLTSEQPIANDKATSSFTPELINSQLQQQGESSPQAQTSVNKINNSKEPNQSENIYENNYQTLKVKQPYHTDSIEEDTANKIKKIDKTTKKLRDDLSRNATHVKEDLSQVVKFNHETSVEQEADGINVTSDNSASSSFDNPPSKQLSENKDLKNKEGKMYSFDQFNNHLEHTKSSDDNRMSLKNSQLPYSKHNFPDSTKQDKNIISETMQTIANNELPLINDNKIMGDEFRNNADKQTFVVHKNNNNEKLFLKTSKLYENQDDSTNGLANIDNENKNFINKDNEAVTNLQQNRNLPTVKEVANEHFATESTKWKDVSDQNHAKDIQQRETTKEESDQSEEHRDHPEHDSQVNGFKEKEINKYRLKLYGQEEAIKQKPKTNQNQNIKNEEKIQIDNDPPRVNPFKQEKTLFQGNDENNGVKSENYEPSRMTQSEQKNSENVDPLNTKLSESYTGQNGNQKFENTKSLDVYKLIAQHKEQAPGTNKGYFYYGKGLGVHESQSQVSDYGVQDRFTDSKKKSNDDSSENTQYDRNPQNGNKLRKESSENGESNTVGTENQDLSVQPEGLKDITKYPKKNQKQLVYTNEEHSYLNKLTPEEFKEREKYVESKQEKSFSHEDEAKILKAQNFKHKNKGTNHEQISEDNSLNDNSMATTTTSKLPLASSANSETTFAKENFAEAENSNSGISENKKEGNKYKVFTSNEDGGKEASDKVGDKYSNENNSGNKNKDNDEKNVQVTVNNKNNKNRLVNKDENNNEMNKGQSVEESNSLGNNANVNIQLNNKNSNNGDNEKSKEQQEKEAKIKENKEIQAQGQRESNSPTTNDDSNGADKTKNNDKTVEHYEKDKDKKINNNYDGNKDNNINQNAKSNFLEQTDTVNNPMEPLFEYRNKNDQNIYEVNHQSEAELTRKRIAEYNKLKYLNKGQPFNKQITVQYASSVKQEPEDQYIPHKKDEYDQSEKSQLVNDDKDSDSKMLNIIDKKIQMEDSSPLLNKEINKKTKEKSPTKELMFESEQTDNKAKQKLKVENEKTNDNEGQIFKSHLINKADNLDSIFLKDEHKHQNFIKEEQKETQRDSDFSNEDNYVHNFISSAKPSHLQREFGANEDDTSSNERIINVRNHRHDHVAQIDNDENSKLQLNENKVNGNLEKATLIDSKDNAESEKSASNPNVDANVPSKQRLMDDKHSNTDQEEKQTSSSSLRHKDNDFYTKDVVKEKEGDNKSNEDNKLKQVLKDKYAQYSKHEPINGETSDSPSEMLKHSSDKKKEEEVEVDPERSDKIKSNFKLHKGTKNDESVSLRKEEEDEDYEPVTLRKQNQHEERESKVIESSKFLPYVKERAIDTRSEKRTSARLYPVPAHDPRGVVTIESNEKIAKHHISRKDEPQQYSQLKRQDNVNAVKKDSTDAKGILTKDAYLDATHYWPFETSHSVLTPDIVTGHNAILMDNTKLKKDNEIGEYVSTENNGSYVIAGDFKDTCFSDPGKCIMGGMTVSFLVMMDDSKLKKEQDAYIISSGGQSKKSRGFAFLYFHGTYVACFSTAEKQWKMTIKDLPQRQWINIAFVWRNNEQLIFFLNGEKKQTVLGTPTSRPTAKFTILTISRPNNAVNTDFMFPLKISSLALWDRPLKVDQVKTCVKSLMQMRKHPGLRRKRSKILRRAFNNAIAKSKRHFIRHV